MISSSRRGALALGLLLACAGTAEAAATLLISNANAPGVGFNDPTPVLPVGGNPGHTLGEQRLIAFQHAANLWGATLTSTVPITIQAQFVALPCTGTSAVLGSAGASEVFSDFPGSRRPDTWYPVALANKLSGQDQDPGVPQINARFNVNLGQPGCLEGTSFYLGLDNQPGIHIDLVTVLLHEFAHGLGFQTYTDGETGAQIGQAPDLLPSIWDHFLTDAVSNRTWADMTDAERVASARNARRLVWGGSIVTGAVPSVLTLGTPRLAISGPAAGAATGDKDIGTASFGRPLSTQPVSGPLMPVIDQPDGTGLACEPLVGLNRLAVRGNVALMDRGGCGYTVKVKHAQDAGAIAAVIADNVPGSPPSGLGGFDDTVTIPSAGISQADGAALRAQLRTRSRTTSGVIASLGINGSQYAGADVFGRALLYAPNPYQPGSSISHFDTFAFPNLLMEPALNPDLVHSVLPPKDLTFRLLQDIGW